MISGHFAFNEPTDYLTWQKIKAVDYEFPPSFPGPAQDLVSKLLVHEPEGRLGVGTVGSSNGSERLKSHAFFEGIEWERLWVMEPPQIEVGIFRKEAMDLGTDGRDDDELDWADA